MFRRRPPVSHRGPGLTRTVARTAVIAGTATAASGAVAGRQQQAQAAQAAKANDAASLAQLQQDVANIQMQQVNSDIQQPAAGGDMIAQLTRLGELRSQGILTEEEFGRAKAQLLGG